MLWAGYCAAQPYKMSTASERSDNENQPLITPHLHRRVRSDIFSPKRHWKNLIILSLTFLFCFTAYGAIQNIQSSVNSSQGLGLLSLGIVYASLIASSLLAPAVIKFFGAKWTIVFCTLCYCIYSYANFFPSYATLIPASCLLGFSAAPLWVAQGTYLTTSAIQLAEIINDVPEFVINRFNGVLYAFFQTNQVWGNILSFTVLNENGTTPKNVSNCGHYSCGASINSESNPPNENDVQVLFGLFSLSGMIAVLLSMCLLDEQPSASTRLETDTGSSASLFTSTLKLMWDFQLFLLIPVFMFSGIEQAFIVGDFTKSYVTCTQGVSMVGVVMIAFGVSDVLSSLIFGQLEKITGRIFLFTLGAIIHLGLMTYLYLWDPKHSQSWQLFVVAAGWGVGDAMWQTQCSSLIGVTFASCQEPAFSNFRLWQSAGFCVSFISSIPKPVCVWHKLIGISAWLIISMVMYYCFEYKIRKEANQVIPERT